MSSSEDLRHVFELDDGEHFEENGYIRNVLRFLQLLCEGHNLKMQVRDARCLISALQHYLRQQTRSIKSHDLVSVTAAFLEVLCRRRGVLLNESRPLNERLTLRMWILECSFL